MGERLIPSEKVALIRYGKGYRRYPLEFMDLLTGIPPWTLTRALAGLTWQQLLNRRRQAEPANAEEALIRLYGKPLYHFFFRDFTHRYWGFPPTELSATFVRSKMPRLSAVDFVKKALGRLGMKEQSGETVEGATARETLWYSRSGSREMPMALADVVREQGVDLDGVLPLCVLGDHLGLLRFGHVCPPCRAVRSRPGPRRPAVSIPRQTGRESNRSNVTAAPDVSPVRWSAGWALVSRYTRRGTP